MPKIDITDIDKVLYGDKLKAIYGPYERTNDLRSHIILYYYNFKRVTKSYPRFLMERLLQRLLKDNEQVDHINEKHWDNSVENFQILSQYHNILKSQQIIKTKVCAKCNIEFLPKRSSQYLYSNKCRYAHTEHIRNK